MAHINHTEIQLKKAKLILLLLSAVIFTAIGLWFLLMQNDVQIYKILGVISILFFGFVASVIARKLQDDTPGLIIDDSGIMDNSNAFATGLIIWRDIKSVFVVEIGRQKFIMVEVYNPEEYIERQHHYLQKKAMQYNLKTYGSPVSITGNGLKCTFDNLYKLIRTNLENQAEYIT
ncbi:MAG: STM3941 family protein [Mucilaginibacter sp.]|uniref:STM3941 family protein n=1 Tax=Mucilaginibacter sp. TaxID=1882438 RepID=UPI0032653564